MSGNPFAGQPVGNFAGPGNNRGLSAPGQTQASDSLRVDHTMGMYRGGGVAQPSLGDLGPMVRGVAGKQLDTRDDDADQAVAGQQ